ncbi:MAG: MFS transporter [Proteobacteria bacterium]|nr:MFS transporter [Pseudomonadota bacterium]
MNAVSAVQLRKNINRTLAFGFFQVFLVVMPVIVPFFESRGLSMRQIFLLQALFAVVVLVMEIPSGYAADILGRRLTMIVGSVFLGLGHSVLLFADGFADLALFELGLGIGVSLVSGADLAILYDSEHALGNDSGRRQELVGRLFTMHTASEALAGVVCSVMLVWLLQSAVYVQAAVGWIPLLIALALVEPPGERMDPKNHFANVREIVEHLLKSGPVLRLTFLALSIWSLTTFYAVWLLQKLWQEQGVELSQFGYLWAIYMLVSAGAGRLALKAEDRFGTTTLLVFFGVLPVIGYAGLALLGTVGGFVAALTFFVARGLGLVVLREAFNKRLSGRFRATANSLASFGFRAAFAITGPFVGWTFDLWGMDVTLALLAVVAALIFAALLLPLVLAVRTAATAVVA